MSVSNQRCAGIDVSKGTLDIAISNIASQFTVPNGTDGFTQFLRELKRNETRLILMEATGGWSQVWLVIFNQKALTLSSLIPARLEILPVQWAIWRRLIV
jgi:transposase